MNDLKLFVFTLCICALLFAIIRVLIPNRKYEKYIRVTMYLIFVILVFRGIGMLSKDTLSLNFEEFERVETDIETQLETVTVHYIDQSLQTAGYFDSFCDGVEFYAENDQYYIKKLLIKSGDDHTDKLKQYISEMCGIQEDCVYVETG